MPQTALIEWCRETLKSNDYIDFPEDIFKTINDDDASILIATFSHHIMMKLPAREIAFHEWLKLEDPPVWEDLWGNSEVEPYLVSMTFLHLLLDETRGFPICDLLTCDNYYFSIDHMPDKEALMFIDSVKDRFNAREKLTAAQLLTLEISLDPIDIWHFAYKYKLPLAKAKQAVEDLVEDGVLIHLKSAEHLANFVEF